MKPPWCDHFTVIHILLWTTLWMEPLNDVDVGVDNLVDNPVSARQALPGSAT